MDSFGARNDSAQHIWVFFAESCFDSILELILYFVGWSLVDFEVGFGVLLGSYLIQSDQVKTQNVGCKDALWKLCYQEIIRKNLSLMNWWSTECKHIYNSVFSLLLCFCPNAKYASSNFMEHYQKDNFAFDQINAGKHSQYSVRNPWFSKNTF